MNGRGKAKRRIDGKTSVFDHLKLSDLEADLQPILKEWKGSDDKKGKLSRQKVKLDRRRKRICCGRTERATLVIIHRV